MPNKILLDGGWRDADRPAGTFFAVNPATGDTLPDEYPVSRWSDIAAALEAAGSVVDDLAGLGPRRIAAFLDTFAGSVESRREELVETAHLETALPVEPRLRSVEFPRLIGQLRQAAEACRD